MGSNRNYLEVLQRIQTAAKLAEKSELQLAAETLILPLERSNPSITPKQAYFKFLQDRTALNLRFDASKATMDKIATHLDNKATRRLLYSLTTATPGSQERLITKQEELFVFFLENARPYIPAQLERIKEKFFNDEVSVEEANWEIAQFLYAGLKFSDNEDDNFRLNIVLGYILEITDDDLVTAKANLADGIRPLDLKHYVMSCMADSALEKLGQKSIEDRAPAAATELEDVPLTAVRKRAPGFYRQTFVQVLLDLMDASKKNESVTSPIFTDRTKAADKKYDADFLVNVDNLILELNQHYQNLKLTIDDEKKKDLEKFVNGVKDYHLEARRRLVGSGSIRTKQEWEDQAQALKESADRLFDQGEPTSVWRMVVGGLLQVLALCLILGGIGALVACPFLAPLYGAAAAGIASATGVAITTAEVAIGSIALGGVLEFFSGLSFFKGASRKPATVLTEAHTVIDFCKNAGLLLPSDFVPEEKEALSDSYVPLMTTV